MDNGKPWTMYFVAGQWKEKEEKKLVGEKLRKYNYNRDINNLMARI